MKRVNLFLFVLIIANLFFNCGSKVPISQNFYKEGKLGIVVVKDTVSIYKGGAQGILDMAISNGSKYKNALHSIDTLINPKKRIIRKIEKSLTAKNKEYTILNENLNFNEIAKFEKPKDSNEKYFKWDLRSYKEKFNVDELMVIQIKYGLMLGYYGMIETDRNGMCNVLISTIDLNDNKIIFQDNIIQTKKISGKWNTPPLYENMQNAIIDASTNTLILLEEKLIPQK